MRKTFAVGKLTGSSSRILLVDASTTPAPPRLRELLDSRDPESQEPPRLPDPRTVH